MNSRAPQSLDHLALLVIPPAEGKGASPASVQTAASLGQDVPVGLDKPEARPYSASMEEAIEANRARQAELHSQYRAFVEKSVNRMDTAEGSAGGIIPTYTQWLKAGLAKPTDPTIKVVGPSRIQELRDSEYVVTSALSANQYVLKDKETGKSELWIGRKEPFAGFCLKYGPHYLEYVQDMNPRQTANLDLFASVDRHEEIRHEEIELPDMEQERLFNAWKDFGHMAAELGCVVQNSLSFLTLEDIKGWPRLADLVRLEFEHLVERTMEMLKRPDTKVHEGMTGILAALNKPGATRWSDVTPEAIHAIFQKRGVSFQNTYQDTQGHRQEWHGFPYKLVGLADPPSGAPANTIPNFVIEFPNGHREAVDAIDIIDISTL
jgi:hypothetical protein